MDDGGLATGPFDLDGLVGGQGGVLQHAGVEAGDILLAVSGSR